MLHDITAKMYNFTALVCEDNHNNEFDNFVKQNPPF